MLSRRCVVGLHSLDVLLVSTHLPGMHETRRWTLRLLHLAGEILGEEYSLS